jgi:hypothetical protein
MTAATARKARVDGVLRDAVEYFEPGNPVHLAHFGALAPVFGDFAAAMIVSQDAQLNPRGALKVTDPGEISSHPGWAARNRAVVHGEKARYEIYDVAKDRIVPLFTRDQTVPAYVQPE